MDRHELDRMFDALTPAPGRERELLQTLLQDGARRKTPMKNWKRLVVAGVAAALLITGAAAAAVPGLSQRLLAYFGVAPEDSQMTALLLPGATAVDITREDNGATLHASQVLWDRTGVRVLVDFTAPEGTVLMMENDNNPRGMGAGFAGKYHAWPYFRDKTGKQMEETVDGSWHWEVVKDEDGHDNHCTLVFYLETHLSETLMENAASMWVPVQDLHYYEKQQWDDRITYPGDWSFEVPLPEKDIGYIWEANQVLGELDGAEITLESVYLSPLCLELIVSREGDKEDLWGEDGELSDKYWRWCTLLTKLDSVTLTTKDGVEAELWSLGGDDERYRFRLGNEYETHPVDPAQFQGGTLTLDLPHGLGEVALPLDQLAPVEP